MAALRQIRETKNRPRLFVRRGQRRCRGISKLEGLAKALLRMYAEADTMLSSYRCSWSRDCSLSTYLHSHVLLQAVRFSFWPSSISSTRKTASSHLTELQKFALCFDIPELFSLASRSQSVLFESLAKKRKVQTVMTDYFQAE